MEARLSSADQATDLLLSFTLSLFALDLLCVKIILENIWGFFVCFFFKCIEKILKKITDVNYN